MASLNEQLGPSSPLYQPLNKNEREIRLLEILPNTPDGKVNCKLHTVLLTPDLYYACLSYVWGDPTVTEQIIVDGIPRQVTINLATALRHIKKHWLKIERETEPELDASKFLLWADALCINQYDLAERTHQVSLMADIYSSADMALAWLSSNDQDVAEAFDIFESGFNKS
ncbi:heterokaryon incompatibility het-6 [Fusarium beomiforme]|uniref:Heterokaryon incompatibility het-6 n=1 Tax=Fusarium beomiforme TaxID=44412 RepID=A0A9P5AKB7_9HYPO|nr:heterokaryon incompatibility het-6 [Fusarium beomiforme]